MKEPTLRELAEELERTRVESVRYRRALEDLLSNLSSENMPEVHERLSSDEDKIDKVVGEGESGAEIRADEIITAINGATGKIAGARFSLGGATAGGLSVGEDGKLTLTTSGEEKITLVLKAAAGVESVTCRPDVIEIIREPSADVRYTGRVGAGSLLQSSERESNGTHISHESRLDEFGMTLHTTVDNGTTTRDDEARYSADGIQLPALATNTVEYDGSTMYRLCVDRDGNLVAVYETE